MESQRTEEKPTSEKCEKEIISIELAIASRIVNDLAMRLGFKSHFSKIFREVT